MRKAFVKEAADALHRLSSEIKYLLFVGHPHTDTQHLYNFCSCCTMENTLPLIPNRNYQITVFDERRYFTEGNESCVVSINQLQTGIVICEDL